MNILIKIFAAIFLLIVCLAPITDVQAQISSPISDLPGSTMLMGFGARGIAMGNAMTAVTIGDLQAYYNPAVVTFQAVPNASIAYTALSLDRKLNFLSYTNSIKPNAGIAVSIINSGTGDIDGRDYDANHTDIYSTSENSFMLSFGLKPDPNLSLGLTTRILYYSLYEEMSSTTVSFDVGIIFRMSEQLVLGLTVQDIGSKYKWDSSKLYGMSGNVTNEKFPLRKRIGASWIAMDSSFIVSGEFEAIGSVTFFRLGSEIEIYKGVYIRGGIDQIALNSDISSRPSLGMGFQTELKNFTPMFEYSYVFEPYSPNGIHLLSLSLRLR